jgi:hypothetical protein
MNTLTWNHQKYYLAEDVKKVLPLVFTGCKTVRELINRKQLTKKTDYVYARHNKDSNIWTLSDGTSMKFDKLFLSKQFVDNEYDTKIPDIYQVEMFDDACTFFGDELEVWGERAKDKCFFRVANVSTVLNMPNLHSTIIKDITGYTIGNDYSHFITKIIGQPLYSHRELYLTYNGLIRVLNVSNNHRLKELDQWIYITLYENVLGSHSRQHILPDNILGGTYTNIVGHLRKISPSIPCIYLMRVGTVVELSDVMHFRKGINNEHIVFKYGRSNNLVARMGSHSPNYMREFDRDITLEYFHCIDPNYLVPAEADVRNYVNDNNISYKYKNNNKLTILSTEQLKKIKVVYSKIGCKYMKCIDDNILALELSQEKCRNKAICAQYDKIIMAEQHNTENVKNKLKFLRAKYRIKELEHELKMLEKDLQISRLNK